MTDLQVIDRAADLPPEWDDLAGPGALHQSRAYLRMSEGYATIPTRYLIRYRGGELVGGLATALTLASSPWLYTRADTALEFAAREGLPGAAECLAALTGGRAIPRSVEEATQALSGDQEAAPATEMLMPSLVCGGRQFNRTRVLTRDDGADGHAVIGELVEQAERVAGELGARSIAFLYMDEHDARLRQTLAERGYLSCVSSRYAKLVLPDGGFEGYKAMLARKQRQSIAAERRKLESAGLKVAREELTESLIEPLAELESQLFAKHGGSWSPQQSAEALRGIMREFGPDAFVLTARVDDELYAFTLVLQHRNEWYLHRGGFDYDRIGELPVYFELTYNAVIERAADAGVATVHYGAQALRAKQLRGCTVITYVAAVRRLAGQSQ